MARRRISTQAVVLPPSRQSETIVVPSEMAADGFARPDLPGRAATAAAHTMNGE
jgi:hypothetical protein